MRSANSFYKPSELKRLGFKNFGKNVLVSRHARFYGAEHMEFGSHVRIDDHCILSGRIKLGSHIHISAYCALYGRFGIEMEDYTGLSPRCTVFSATDDFSGAHLIGPMVDSKFRKLTGGKVLIRKYSQIGAHCVVFPGVTLGEGVAVGAMSLVNKPLAAWTVYHGIPARKKGKRSKGMTRHG